LCKYLKVYFYLLARQLIAFNWNLFISEMRDMLRKQQRGPDMEHDELEEDRAAFIAGEIGGAVVELIINGVVISRDAIVDSLEAKRRAVGNVIHKGVLRDAAAMVRKGQ
jgi:hypothetical protein